MIHATGVECGNEVLQELREKRDWGRSCAGKGTYEPDFKRYIKWRWKGRSSHAQWVTSHGTDQEDRKISYLKNTRRQTTQQAHCLKRYFVKEDEGMANNTCKDAQHH